MTEDRPIPGAPSARLTRTAHAVRFAGSPRHFEGRRTMLNRKTLAALGMTVFCATTWLYAQKGAGKALTAQDLVDIQQLYAKYNWTLDSGDADGYASTFTPDGVFNNNVGHDAIVKFANGFHTGIGSHVRHWNTNL